MRENKKLLLFYSFALIVSGICYLYYTIKYIKKGQIRSPSIWDKKPGSFKKEPFISTVRLIGNTLIILFALIGGIIGIIYIFSSK